MRNFNSVYSFKLLGDGSPQKIATTFNYFMCRTADQDFEMSFDGQTWFPMGQGESFGPMAHDEHEFSVRASASVDTNISVRCSNMVNANNRLNLIRNDNSTLVVGAKLPPTYSRGFNTSLGAGVTISRLGTNAGNQRAYLHIFNRSVVSLTVQDALGTTMAAVDAGCDLPIETSDTIKLYNANASAMDLLVMEVFYSA